MGQQNFTANKKKKVGWGRIQAKHDEQNLLADGTTGNSILSIKIKERAPKSSDQEKAAEKKRD